VKGEIDCKRSHKIAEKNAKEFRQRTRNNEGNYLMDELDQSDKGNPTGEKNKKRSFQDWNQRGDEEKNTRLKITIHSRKISRKN